MTELLLSEFLRDAGDRLYRKLVQHQIRQRSERQLRDALEEAVRTLPTDLQPYVAAFVHDVHLMFDDHQHYWRTATCRIALDLILKGAFGTIPMPNSIPSKAAMLEPKNERFAFQLFQIATLSFACSAASQREQRRFMGIRKGLFR